MATVHMIHGFLGVGKTRFAKSLAEKHPALRFSPDEWMVHFYGNDPPEALFGMYQMLIMEMIERYWTQSLSLGLDVILDTGFWTRFERDTTRKTAASLGADVQLYKLELADDLAWKRIEDRNREVDEVFISKATYATLKQRFEPLTDDEPHRVIFQGDF